jgi:serine/threonine-protein kinase
MSSGRSRRTDVFAASIVLWEILTGERLFAGESDGETIHRLIDGEIEPPSAAAPGVPAALDEVVLRGLERDPEARFATASQMAEALERAAPPATRQTVAAWIDQTAGGALQALRTLRLRHRRPRAPPP